MAQGMERITHTSGPSSLKCCAARVAWGLPASRRSATTQGRSFRLTHLPYHGRRQNPATFHAPGPTVRGDANDAVTTSWQKEIRTNLRSAPRNLSVATLHGSNE